MPRETCPSHLKKNEKLTLAEHKRCLNNKLYMFCNGTGYMAYDCMKSSFSAAKRCATSASSNCKDSGNKSELKK